MRRRRRSSQRILLPQQPFLLLLSVALMLATTVRAFVLPMAATGARARLGWRVARGNSPSAEAPRLLVLVGRRRAMSMSTEGQGQDEQADTTAKSPPSAIGGAAADAAAATEERSSTSSSRRPRGGSPKEKLRAIRQHVNPLSRSYQQPVELPAGWVQAAFADPRRPCHIDIGSARGRFCVDMALAYPEVNFLGLEIRRPAVEEAFKKRERAGAAAAGNCHFLACNANVDLARVVADVQRQGAEVVRVSIQFPDPHFKKKHKKRRVVQPGLVDVVCASLKAPGGEIFLQSDVEEVVQSMREAFAEDPRVRDACPPGEWMPENPLGVPTEREKLTLSRGDPVYRTVFTKP